MATGLPHTVLCPLVIRRDGVEFGQATLAFAFGDGLKSGDRLAAEILGPAEFTYFSKLPFPRRQQSYLLGRYAAKTALQSALGETDLRRIEIGRGVFDQPLVLSTRGRAMGVTISHAEPVAVALAFPSGHPMGIDLETIDAPRDEVVRSQLSVQEIAFLDGAVQAKLGVAFALWTAKEALAKVLQTGLMSPLSIYNLSRFEPVGGVWEGQFVHFAQYKVTTWIGSAHALSVVSPKRSVLSFSQELWKLI